MTTPAFPRPRETRRRASVVVRITRSGFEICNTKTIAGRNEYRWRTLDMLDRQGGRCCLAEYAPMCTGRLYPDYATMDHEHGRGGGKRDDRIALPDGTWQNGACHVECNGWKGSRFIPYNERHNNECR
jgi:hypothetical protein